MIITTDSTGNVLFCPDDTTFNSGGVRPQTVIHWRSPVPEVDPPVSPVENPFDFNDWQHQVRERQLEQRIEELEAQAEQIEKLEAEIEQLQEKVDNAHLNGREPQLGGDRRPK